MALKGTTVDELLSHVESDTRFDWDEVLFCVVVLLLPAIAKFKSKCDAKILSWQPRNRPQRPSLIDNGH
jgi:hypothetical protein